MHHHKANSTPLARLLRMGLAALLAGLVSAGCRHGNAINFVTNTQFGLKVGVNAEKIPEVQIGYNRQEAARVPVYLEQDGKVSVNSSITPDVNSVLKQAKIELDSSRTAEAIALIKQAYGIEPAAGETRSPVLNLIKTEADKGNSANASLLKSLIQAELDRPAEVRQFFADAKFIGRKNDTKEEDAYSVFGTFKGAAGGGSSNTVSGNLKLAQFFATGIAAQELARHGGAAAVNPAISMIPEKGVDPDDVKKAQETAVTNLQEAQAIAKHIFTPVVPAGGGAAAVRTETERKAELQRLTGDLTQGEADSLAKVTDEKVLASLLRDFRSRNKMFRALP